MPLYHILPILCSKRIKPLLLQLSSSKTTEEALIGLTRVTVLPGRQTKCEPLSHHIGMGEEELPQGSRHCRTDRAKIHKSLDHVALPLWPAQTPSLRAGPREQPPETRAHSLCTILVKAVVSIRINRMFMTFHEFIRVGKGLLISFSIKFQQRDIFIYIGKLHGKIHVFQAGNHFQMLKYFLYSSI